MTKISGNKRLSAGKPLVVLFLISEKGESLKHFFPSCVLNKISTYAKVSVVSKGEKIKFQKTFPQQFI